MSRLRGADVVSVEATRSVRVAALSAVAIFRNSRRENGRCMILLWCGHSQNRGRSNRSTAFVGARGKRHSTKHGRAFSSLNFETDLLQILRILFWPGGLDAHIKRT